MKILKIIITFGVLASMFFMTGCDQFENFSVNVPLTITFNESTQNSTINRVESYDLDNNSVYNEYKDRIENFEFVEARYVVTEIDPADLTGDIVLTVRRDDEDGHVLFTAERTFDPETDLNTSYDFVLTAEEISFFNSYLMATGGSKVFWGEADITNIEGSSETKEVTVKVHLLLKAKGTL